MKTVMQTVKTKTTSSKTPKQKTVESVTSFVEFPILMICFSIKAVLMSEREALLLTLKHKWESYI